MNNRRKKARHAGLLFFLAVMFVTLPTVAFAKTADCYLSIEPDVGVLWLEKKSTNRGTWAYAPAEIVHTLDLRAEYDAGLIGTNSFSGDISYQIGSSETYIDIHLTCNIWSNTGIDWNYTRCSLSGNHPGDYTCEKPDQVSGFVVSVKEK